MTTSTIEDVIVFAPTGGNASLLVTLAWKLWVARRWRVVAVHAPLLERGAMWAETELLAAGAALDQLHDVVGEAVMPRKSLFLPVVQGGDGLTVADEDTAEAALAYQEAVLRIARQALRTAGDRRVVFALIAGRRRTMTVTATVVAQLLARRQDVVVDLRIRPEEAGSPVGFFFPTQREARFGARGLVASEVEVELVEVRLPRLGALDPNLGNASSYAALVSRGQEAIDEVSSLRLDIRLAVAERGAFVTDLRTGAQERIPLADTHLLYLASLCLGHAAKRRSVWLDVAKPRDRDHPFARLCRDLEWAAQNRSSALRVFQPHANFSAAERAALSSTALPQLRSKARGALAAFAAERDVRYRALVPEVEKAGPNGRERLPLRNFVVHR